MTEPNPNSSDDAPPAQAMLKKCGIEVEGFGLIQSFPGPLFLDVLNRQGLDLHNDCGGYGKCGKCKIQFHSEAPECLKGDERHLSAEDRAAGLRLACFHQVRRDCRISIPPRTEFDLLDDLSQSMESSGS